MALLADRVDPATVTVDTARETATRLVNSVRIGQVRPIGRVGAPRPIDDLVAGVVDAAVVRASDTVGLEHDHPDIGFVVPEEGGLLMTDVALVPIGAPNLEGAKAYLQYVTDPVHGTERFRVVPAMWPESAMIDDILRRDAPDVVADPRRNPPPDIRARLRPFRLLGEADERAFNALFDGVIHAAR
jgi:spermidine/putrescine transport system substrate-binding protein